MNLKKKIHGEIFKIKKKKIFQLLLLVILTNVKRIVFSCCWLSVQSKY